MIHHTSVYLSRRQAMVGALGLAILPFSKASAQSNDVFTFGVLGLDTRSDDSGNIRSDTIMVSRVNLNQQTVRTLSIPRDLYVEIPGHGSAKINDAYTVGLAADPSLNWESGAASFQATLEHNFGVVCDGMAVSDLLRFPAIIDAVGGIEVDNPYAVYVEGFDDIYGTSKQTLDFPAGLISLNGAQAMDFVRTRQQDGDGGRVMRQHLVLVSILRRLQEPETIPRIPDLIVALADAVRTDIAPDVQARLITLLPSLSEEHLSFTNIDTLLTSGYTSGGAWIYQADWATLPGYVQSWLDGDVGEHLVRPNQRPKYPYAMSEPVR